MTKSRIACKKEGDVSLASGISKDECIYRILVTVGKDIRSGKHLDRGKLVEAVFSSCFPEGHEHEELWKTIIDRHIDLLLRPDPDENGNRLPLIHYIEEACEKCEDDERRCADVCPTAAIVHDETGRLTINEEDCIECGRCVDACVAGAIVERSDFVKVAAALIQEGEIPVYAILAPAFTGQFGRDLSPQNVKAMFEALGFTGVYEVAMAADVITMIEAEEFVERMEHGEEFMITSCCCPAFIKLVEKKRPALAGVVSPSVSPMVAMGRLLKSREPGCRVVFIGPCIAKKSEARLPDVGDAINCVLTFKETRALLETAGIDLGEKARDVVGWSQMEDASHDGRIYAHTGGVTEAITRAVKALRPQFEVRAVKGNGIKECAELLKQAEEGTLDANFMEGMGCPGGCVGGPGTVIDSEEAAHHVASFADDAQVKGAFDNDLAIWWLEHHARDRNMFSRKYNPEGAEDPRQEVRVEEHRSRVQQVARIAKDVRERRDGAGRRTPPVSGAMHPAETTSRDTSPGSGKAPGGARRSPQ